MEPSQISQLVDMASWYLTFGFLVGLLIVGFMRGSRKVSGLGQTLLIFVVVVFLWVPVILISIGYQMGKDL